MAEYVREKKSLNERKTLLLPFTTIKVKYGSYRAPGGTCT
jgi:hypothetical protein